MLTYNSTEVGAKKLRETCEQLRFKFLQEAERLACKQIVIATPLGFYPQTYEDPDQKPDRWGMYGGVWQTHRSGWAVDDFGEEWELICCADFHQVDQDVFSQFSRGYHADWIVHDQGGSNWLFQNNP